MQWSGAEKLERHKITRHRFSLDLPLPPGTHCEKAISRLILPECLKTPTV